MKKAGAWLYSLTSVLCVGLCLSLAQDRINTKCSVPVVSIRSMIVAHLPLGRRTFSQRLVENLGSAAGAALLGIQPVQAKQQIQQLEEDKYNLWKGLKRLNYLLDNWEAETTICGISDNPYTGTKGCERDPLKVMDYLGYKSMENPLFKAEKKMRRLESLVPSEYEVEFLDAVEKWAETADEGSGMAYVSSWGEANPGGGKDRVEFFIERAKKNVIDARDSLSTVVNILKIGPY